MIRTPDEFRSNELLRTSLEESLKSQPMQIALGIVRSLGEPRELGDLPPNVGLLEFNALQNARREGFFHALAMLQGLAVPPVKPKSRPVMPPLVDEDTYEPERTAE